MGSSNECQISLLYSIKWREGYSEINMRRFTWWRLFRVIAVRILHKRPFLMLNTFSVYVSSFIVLSEIQQHVFTFSCEHFRWTFQCVLSHQSMNAMAFTSRPHAGRWKYFNERNGFHVRPHAVCWRKFSERKCAYVPPIHCSLCTIQWTQWL